MVIILLGYAVTVLGEKNVKKKRLERGLLEMSVESLLSDPEIRETLKNNPI